LKAASGVDKQLVTDVSLFDIYEGKGVEPGKKSIGVSIILQPKDKTLTDAEIEAVAVKLVAEVVKKTGAVLRG
jgi:phenylalanyl-tRNA synthetase beta chain